MKIIEIKEIGIDSKGLLFVRPNIEAKSESAIFQYVYRAAMGVYWNENEQYFHSNLPANEDMTYEKWYKQILQAVKEELGCSLEISKNTKWNCISNRFERVIGPVNDQNIYYPLAVEEVLQKKLSGMTVNERLYETGQLETYDAAIKSRDRILLRKICESIFLDEASIQMLLKKI